MSIKAQVYSFDLNKLIKEKVNLENAKLEVGFLQGATYPNGTSVAMVAFYNEFGTINIPPRPFFRNAISNDSNKWGRVFTNTYRDTNNITQTLGVLGNIIKGSIIQSISATNEPPNAISTIKQKKSSKPLVDTGKLKASVTFKISRIK